MISNKNLVVAAMISLGLLVSGAANAKAKFYFNVCIDSSKSAAAGGLNFGSIMSGGIGASNVTPVLALANYVGGTGIFTGSKFNAPDCKNGMVNALVEDPAKGDFANWKPNDTQVLRETVLKLNLGSVTGSGVSPVTGAVKTFTGSCGDMPIPLEWVVGSTSGDWRNFAPVTSNGQGLIKIVVVANLDNSLTCSYSLN